MFLFFPPIRKNPKRTIGTFKKYITPPPHRCPFCALLYEQLGYARTSEDSFIFAATMKSFSDKPCIACVVSTMPTLPHESAMSG
jgi:hypothetical protein